MSSPRWQIVFSVFEEAIELSPEERQAFLDRACRDDPQLRRGVEELLAVHDGGTTFLDRPLIDRSPIGDRPDTFTVDGTATLGLSARPEPAIDVGELFGPYRLLREVGQGGMSTVYLAARADDAYSRQVVIKVVRSDMRSAEMLRRLRTERQILANLEHPNVARLYDGGSTADGMPYFVMEYVEGVPIDVYCEQNRLAVAARLALFRKVCEALSYAHQNLVVHRDIKPSNILVTADGEPKLLDFGIAKMLEPEPTASTVEPTAAWMRMMTPSYASPEQIRGEPITTVSDVYSLGVLLYVLLTGRLPYQLAGRSWRDIERLLTETEPPKPSTTSPIQPPEVGGPRDGETAIARSGVPRRLLAGDLDAIALKALRTVPAQRYSSVERFVADVECFQRGLPVSARAGSWRYRAGRFLRRHRRAVAAAVLVAAVLAGFAVAMAQQARRVAAERDKKAQVVNLLRNVFELSNPYVLPESELTVREAFERSLPLIENRLRDQPQVRAELLHTTGTILNVLGFHARAEEQLVEALEIRQRESADPLEIAETTSALAVARKEQGRPEEAEALARQAVEMFRERLGEGHPGLIEPLIELVSVLCYQADYTAAEPLASEALALASGLPPGSAGEIAALEYLAQSRSAAGDYEQAVAFNRRALALYRERYGEKFPGQIVTLNNVGLQLRRLSRFEEAQAAYERAFALQREVFGEDSVDAVLLNNLAGLRFATGDYAGAEALYRETLEVVRERYGPDHWRVLFVGLRAAQARMRRGDAVAAEREVRDLTARRLVADDHWLKAEADNVLGASLSWQGRCDEAEPILVASFETLLDKATRERTRADALERLSAHLERCGSSRGIERYRKMLGTVASRVQSSR